jgi:hypothetical protein
VTLAVFSRKDSNISVGNGVWSWIGDKEIRAVRYVLFLEHELMSTETADMFVKFFSFEASE